MQSHLSIFAFVAYALGIFFLLRFESSLYILYSSFFVAYVVCTYFLPGCTFSFHFFPKVFYRVNIFNFDEVELVNIFSYGLCFGVKLKKSAYL